MKNRDRPHLLILLKQMGSVPIFLSLFLFLSLFRFGLLLAEHKTLWTDEINSQVHSVRALSYQEILLGKVGEGNNSPLFYLLQKAFCDLTGYHTPPLWIDGHRDSEDLYSKIFLRINPVFFMSLAIVAIFYYFTRFHSLFWGVYSLFLSLTSYMIWIYWAEARPYALWVFLTTAQSLIFLYLVEQNREGRKVLISLGVVHWLLSLTVVFSMAQIFIVSFLLWLLNHRRWPPYIWLTLIPMAVAFFYYPLAPKLEFYFGLTPEQLIRDCISRDRFYILFIFIFFLGLYGLQKKFRLPKLFRDTSLLNGLPYLGVMVLMLLAAFTVLVIFKLNDHGTGFGITSRYFIYLTPIGIIATTLFSKEVILSLSANRLIQAAAASGIGYLVIHRLFKMIPHIKSLCAGIFA